MFLEGRTRARKSGWSNFSLHHDNEPLLYGKTDFGSEFTLYNDLDTSLKIEIPSFVIDVLAEDTDGEYYPVIINGFDDPIEHQLMNFTIYM